MTDGPAHMFRALLLNDDTTPMEFVVHVLKQMFGKDRKIATMIMLKAHHTGSGDCGSYPFAVADAKANEVGAFAREHGHPLRCIVEAAPK